MGTHMTQENYFTAEAMWFHVFKDMIDSGDLIRLDGGALKVYLVIKSFANFSTGSAFPSIGLIASKTGLSERQIIRCIADLEQAGYVSKERAGRHNTYKLREKIVIKDLAGEPHAIATWDYLPGSVREAVADLKNVLVTGDFSGAKVINIQHLALTVNVVNAGDNSVNVVDSVVGNDQVAKLKDRAKK